VKFEHFISGLIISFSIIVPYWIIVIQKQISLFFALIGAISLYSLLISFKLTVRFLYYILPSFLISLLKIIGGTLAVFCILAHIGFVNIDPFVSIFSPIVSLITATLGIPTSIKLFLFGVFLAILLFIFLLLLQYKFKLDTNLATTIIEAARVGSGSYGKTGGLDRARSLSVSLFVKEYRALFSNLGRQKKENLIITLITFVIVLLAGVMFLRRGGVSSFMGLILLGGFTTFELNNRIFSSEKAMWWLRSVARVPLRIQLLWKVITATVIGGIIGNLLILLVVIASKILNIESHPLLFFSLTNSFIIPVSAATGVGFALARLALRSGGDKIDILRVIVFMIFVIIPLSMMAQSWITPIDSISTSLTSFMIISISINLLICYILCLFGEKIVWNFELD
jgi:hypothetical protein